MALNMCNGGAITLLTSLLAATDGGSLHLFNSNITPSDTDVASTYTGHETSFTGYSSTSLSSATWTTPSTVSSAAQSSYNTSPISWSCSGSGDTIYGAYVLDSSGNLLWAEAFSTPRTLADGDVLTYQPIFTLANAG